MGGYGGPVVCCMTATDQAAIDFCREYIARHGYTREQVKILKKNGTTMVIALAPLWQTCNSPSVDVMR
jgi:hypothetical protein